MFVACDIVRPFLVGSCGRFFADALPSKLRIWCRSRAFAQNLILAQPSSCSDLLPIPWGQGIQVCGFLGRFLVGFKGKPQGTPPFLVVRTQKSGTPAYFTARFSPLGWRLTFNTDAKVQPQCGLL